MPTNASNVTGIVSSPCRCAIALGKRVLKGARSRLERYERAARFTRTEELYQNAHKGLRETAASQPAAPCTGPARASSPTTPRKASAHRTRRVPQVMIDALNETWDSARSEVLAATAYFVPGRKGTRDLVAHDEARGQRPHPHELAGLE